MKVVNLRKEKYTVYIGRGSIFGNPYKIDKDNTREEVINLYRYYVRTNLKVLKAICELPKDAILGCYCKPLKCHGNVIVEFYNNYWKICKYCKGTKVLHNPIPTHSENSVTINLEKIECYKCKGTGRRK